MRTHKHPFFRWIAVACTAAAVAAPAGQAIGPDDRAYFRGASPALAPGSVHPDDRLFYRGAASDASAPASLSPDDRAFARNLGKIGPSTLEPVTVAVEVPSSGFDWTDAAIGGTFGLAVALLGIGAILITRRRGTLRPA